MQIVLKSNKQKITIDLFDIPVVERWFNYYREIVNTTDYYTFAGNFVNDDALQRRTDQTPFIDSLWEGIKTDIEKLSRLGYVIPFLLPDQFDYNQNILNRLHRFFTYNALWYFEKGENPFDPNFQLPDDISYNQWHELIDPINVKVHELEIYSNPSKNKKFICKRFPIGDLHCRTRQTNSWLEFTPDELKHNYSFFDFARYENLVLLDNSILGKSILQSFYENDDPTCKDCTGRLGSYGGFLISKNNNRKQIYQSQRFYDWHNSYGLSSDQIPHEFVIGKCKHISQDVSADTFAQENWSVIFK